MEGLGTVGEQLMDAMVMVGGCDGHGKWMETFQKRKTYCTVRSELSSALSASFYPRDRFVRMMLASADLFGRFPQPYLTVTQKL